MTNEEGGIGESRRLGKGDRVSPASLKTCDERGHSDPGRWRGPRVLVAMHEFDCDECTRYVKSVASHREVFATWGGELAVVVPACSGASTASLAELGVAVLRDPDRVLLTGQLAVIVADEWGEIHFASEAEDAHGAISPAELLEWVKFVAIQCPECEGPEGEWRNV
jgi:hypothetical protein